MRYQRATEKLADAVYKLAVGEGDVRSRLQYAYLVLNRLNESELPPSLVDEWNSIKLQLTRLGPKCGPDGEVWQNALLHTLSRIRNRTGSQIAVQIFMLRERLSHLIEREKCERKCAEDC